MMEIKVGLKIGQITIEERGRATVKAQQIWWCRCSCGSPLPKETLALLKAVEEEEDICCKGCLKNRKRKAKLRKKRKTSGPRKNLKRTTLYLLHTKETDFYKIGHGSSPESRARDLQVGNPQEIEVIIQAEGCIYDEWRLHQQFVKNHLRGEWFLFSEVTLIEVKKAFTKLS